MADKCAFDDIIRGQNLAYPILTYQKSEIVDDHITLFLGVAQILTDIAPLVGRCISFERLVHGSLIREGESQMEQQPPAPPPPPPPPTIGRRVAPRGSHLRLVKNSPAEDTLQLEGDGDFAAIIAAAGAAFACPETMF